MPLPGVFARPEDPRSTATPVLFTPGDDGTAIGAVFKPGERHPIDTAGNDVPLADVLELPDWWSLILCGNARFTAYENCKSDDRTDNPRCK